MFCLFWGQHAKPFHPVRWQEVLRRSKGLKDLFINREIMDREWFALLCLLGCLTSTNNTCGSDPCYRCVKKYTLTRRFEMPYDVLSHSQSNSASFTLSAVRKLICFSAEKPVGRIYNSFPLFFVCVCLFSWSPLCKIRDPVQHKAAGSPNKALLLASAPCGLWWWLRFCCGFFFVFVFSLQEQLSSWLQSAIRGGDQGDTSI